ncbi:hypothetical protein GCM10012279_24590 [Micromonospora yangpuensis]|nr:hypothetical protein GCM10012279_24590 [Micromonospora yangpuensis]
MAACPLFPSADGQALALLVPGPADATENGCSGGSRETPACRRQGRFQYDEIGARRPSESIRTDNSTIQMGKFMAKLHGGCRGRVSPGSPYRLGP